MEMGVETGCCDDDDLGPPWVAEQVKPITKNEAKKMKREEEEAAK